MLVILKACNHSGDEGMTGDLSQDVPFAFHLDVGELRMYRNGILVHTCSTCFSLMTVVVKSEMASFACNSGLTITLAQHLQCENSLAISILRT